MPPTPESPPPQAPARGAFRFAVTTALATYALLLVGGAVNPTGSSLACPDWPTCHGSFFPEMVGGVFFEHSHRLAATLVGLLTVLLAAGLTWRWRADVVTRRRAWVAVGLVVLQGVLGGITVIFELPPAVSMSHLGLSMIFFAWLIHLCFRTAAPRETVPRGSAWRWAAAAAGLTWVQIVLGGLVRHSGASHACGTDVPLCGGALWPAAILPQIHMVHRLGALAVTAAVVVAAALAWRRASARGQHLARWTAAAAPVLVVAQVALGLWTVATGLGVLDVVAHLGLGALLFADLVVLTLALGRAGQGVAAAPARAGQTARDVVSLAKPSILTMSVMMAGLGLYLAPGSLPWAAILAALVGTGMMVGSANALNMVVERDVDGLMRRTADRPLPAGRLATGAALTFGVALGVLGTALLWFANNDLTALLGAVALFLYVLVYTPMKRRSPLALLVGAVPGAAPPLMGWTAATGELGGPGLVLFGIVFVWQIPHFLAIALYRKVDYARAGIRIVPVVAGDDLARRLAVVYATALLPLSVVLLPLGAAGAVYVAGALAAGAWFLGACVRGYGSMPTPRWARRVLLASLVYLPAIGVALVADKVLARLATGWLW